MNVFRSYKINKAQRREVIQPAQKHLVSAEKYTSRHGITKSESRVSFVYFRIPLVVHRTWQGLFLFSQVPGTLPSVHSKRSPTLEDRNCYLTLLLTQAPKFCPQMPEMIKCWPVMHPENTV
jgi:hypothetical protein